ncbi:MAG: flavin-dependent oxidoreductase, F420-dependent methylene-tetrahydromethanopterin reductase [Actinomycetia bacterium]|jgi:probable F420-dependent oxidoreductase|nr:flavin-dependent oxidoreductase, F420-dependent methylene-tetrahydromethanopterin reductase [Actinomycetes bacterium]
MRFGLTLPHYGFSLPSGETSFSAVAGWAKRAEDLGFDSVWVSDHFFYSFARYGGDPAPIASLEPLTTLAGIAAVTDRVRLGTLVLCSAFRHPALLARIAASIDLLSDGRLDLGLGAGWMRAEFDAFGYRFGTAGERFEALEESLDVVRRLFGGDPTTFDGPSVTLREAVLAPAPERPPAVWVGGKGGPRLLRVAARLADGWNMGWRVAPEAYVGKVSDVHAACDATGRDPATFGLSVGLYSLIGEDEASSHAAFDRGRAAAPGDAMAGDDYGSWRADTLSGTPDQILERVAAFESLGVRELIVSPWVLPFAIHEPDQVELFAERVIAATRGA